MNTNDLRADIEALVSGPLGTRDEEGRQDEAGSWLRGARHMRVELMRILDRHPAEPEPSSLAGRLAAIRAETTQ